MIQLFEDTRTQLAQKSKNAGPYKDQKYGKNRYERRTRSSISSVVKEFNHVDMNQLFKNDVLEVKVPVKGETNDYFVSVRFDGLMNEIKQAVKNNNYTFEYKVIAQALTKRFNTAQVYVKCTCEDWKFNFEHVSIEHGYGTSDTAHDPGPGKGLANPDDNKGRGCKHVQLVLSNGSWILKLASVIQNYSTYMAEHKPKIFNKLMLPKIYGVELDELAQAGILDEETQDEVLDSTSSIIDTVNEFAKNRGKIKKGSNRNTSGKDKEDRENDIRTQADELKKKQEQEKKAQEEEQARLDKIAEKEQKEQEKKEKEEQAKQEKEMTTDKDTGEVSFEDKVKAKMELNSE